MSKDISLEDVCPPSDLDWTATLDEESRKYALILIREVDSKNDEIKCLKNELVAHQYQIQKLQNFLKEERARNELTGDLVKRIFIDD